MKTKTAYLIGGYARSGKSTMMSLLRTLDKKTFSTSETLAGHTRLLFPDLIAYLDCTTDSAKAMSWDAHLIELDTSWVKETLKFLKFAASEYHCAHIVDDFYARLGASPKVTLRQIMIAVAESHRTIFPDIYVTTTLDKATQHPVIYIETIGGQELDTMVEILTSESYNIVGLNMRSESEQPGVDIRELICVYQCNTLYSHHNDMRSKQELRDWLMTSPIM